VSLVTNHVIQTHYDANGNLVAKKQKKDSDAAG
jgi:hypothetical protein